VVAALSHIGHIPVSTRRGPVLAGGRRWRLGLPVGLGLVATFVLGELVWSLLRAPAWVAGLGVTHAALLGGVLVLLGRTFRRIGAYHARVARAQALVRTYVPAPLAERLLDADLAAHVALHRRTLSVIFADLQSFVEITEAVDPEVLTCALDAYFAAADDAARAEGGTIHKFLGDGVMILFGLEPEVAEHEHALRAVRAAVALQDLVGRLALGRAASRETLPLVVRVGIATGVVSVGSIGPASRRDFTAIGPAVNLAARLQAHCRPGGVLLDHATWALVRDRLDCVPRGEIRVKGARQPLPVYEAAAGSLPTRML